MIIHQHWLVTPMPDDIMENVSTMVEMNQEHEHILWTDERAITEFPELEEFIKSGHTPTFISNMLRLKAAKKYGGIYIDADTMPLKPLSCIPRIEEDITTVCLFEAGNFMYQSGYWKLSSLFDIDSLIENYDINKMLMGVFNEAMVGEDVNVVSYELVGPDGSILKDLERRSWIKDGSIINKVDVMK